MADDDRAPPSTTEPETVENVEEHGEERESGASTSGDTGRNSHEKRWEEEEEGNSGYFSRMLRKKIGGDDLERRIELIDKEEESVESRMIIRERTAEQVNRSLIFLSINLEVEFVAGIYAFLRIRSRNLTWRGRAIRILPMFLVPAVASFFYSLFSSFTSMLNLRDRRLLERLRKDREAKMQELKGRANNYMAKRHIQNCHGESSSVASSSVTNLPEVSGGKYQTVHPVLSRGKSKLHPDAISYLVSCKPVVHDENGKKKLMNLLICCTCRMHNGFASRDELPFVSYKCPHCNSLNGPHIEPKVCDSASTSRVGAHRSQTYNPFLTREMPRGISIEEITPNHETNDPEMDAPVMIIRESPTIGGREELVSDFTPDTMTSVTVRKLPIGLSIEEMTSNEETINADIEPSVMITPESPAAVTPLLIPEMDRGLSVEEVSSSDQQVEDQEAISPLVFLQESPLAGGQVEVQNSQNLAAAAPITAIPSGLSIEEMTPTQDMADPETEPPVMIIRESPSAGAQIMGDSSFITPLVVQEMATGLSIEEVSPNHQLTEDCKTEPPVMFVQLPLSLRSPELSVRIPNPTLVTSVSVPETPGFSVVELSPNQQGNEDTQDPPVMIIQDSPSGGMLNTLTPLEIPELSDNAINPDSSARSPNDSINWSTPGSSALTESSVTFQSMPELGQEEINANDMTDSSDNESLDRYLHGNADVHSPIKATAVTSQSSLSGSHLSSENGSVTDSDYESLTDASEKETILDQENRVEAGGALKGNSVRVLEQSSRNAEEEDKTFNSTYDDSMDTYSGFRSSGHTSGVTGSSTVSTAEEQWGEWQQSEEHLSGPTSGKKISDSLNLATTGPTLVEETQLIVEEMSPTETRDEVEEFGGQQDGPRGSVSGDSDTAEELIDETDDYTGRDHPNHVGSVAYDRDKESSQHLRKGVGGMKKNEDNIIQDKKKREEIIKEIPRKERSLKNQVTKPEPIAKPPAALISPTSSLDPESRPFTGIVSSPASSQWGTGTGFDFEPPREVGLRHRR